SNAVNIGAQLAYTDYLFISNDDMYYAPNWNKNITFEHLVFSPNLVEPTNNPGSAVPFLKADAGFMLDEFRRGVLDHYIAMNLDEDNTVESGFNFPVFIKRDL